jgi:fermentation-respiration switch protein FrsA (DUF1100 family)
MACRENRARAGINPIDCLDHCRIPLALVHGRRDQLVPLSEGEALFNTYQGPKRKLWLDDADHFNLLHVAGDEYLAHLRQFFAEQQRSDASR